LNVKKNLIARGFSQGGGKRIKTLRAKTAKHRQLEKNWVKNETNRYMKRSSPRGKKTKEK